MEDLYKTWIESKKAERKAMDKRREIEDRLISMLKVPDTLEGTLNYDTPSYKVKIVGRMNRKVDGDRIQELAAENGLTDVLPNLFSWKPTIIMAAWKNTNETITNLLLGGIETKPGRPSFTITKG